MSTSITVTGNVGSADLKYTSSGKALLTMSVAHNRRRMNAATREWEDAGTDWYRVSLWDAKAEAAAEVVVKGARVIVVGELESREFTADGANRTAWEVRASEVGVVARSGGAPKTTTDPWASAAVGAGEEVAAW